MKTEKRRCRKCGKIKCVFRVDSCARCYNCAISTKRFEKIVSHFVPASDYNYILFALYVAHRRKSARMEFKYINAIQMLSERLASTALIPICSWIDIYKLSQEFAIGPEGDRRGCPIFLIGKLLERNGTIKRSPKSYAFFQYYARLKNADGNLVRRYTESISLRRHHLDVALKRLEMISDFGHWNSDDLHSVTPEKARHYVDHLSEQSDAVTFRENLSALTRFYDWVSDASGLFLNPFARLDLTSLLKICPRCRKTKTIPNASQKCRLCLVDEKMIGYIEGFRQRLLSRPKYHQYLFESYLKYIKRHRVTHTSWSESKILVELLSSQDFAPLLTWRDVLAASALYRARMGRRKILKGCPFIKIGHILEELGVIPLRNLDEYSRNLLLVLTADLFKLVEYAADLFFAHQSHLW